MKRLLKRIQEAVFELDLGIPRGKFMSDLLGATNQALREVGGAQIQSLDDDGPLLRAALALEAASPTPEETV